MDFYPYNHLRDGVSRHLLKHSGIDNNRDTDGKSHELHSRTGRDWGTPYELHPGQSTSPRVLSRPVGRRHVRGRQSMGRDEIGSQTTDDQVLQKQTNKQKTLPP